MQATVGHPIRSKRALMRTVLATLAALSCGLVAGCTASASAVEPPQDQIFFPTGMGIAPDDSVLFVANANSELQYDSGSISVFDLSLVDKVIAAWTSAANIPDGCNQDDDFHETLVCDETQFIRPDSGVRVGNFATDIAVQDTGSGTFRLIVPTRGDPSITWIDYDGTKLSCTSNQDQFGLCDDAHRLSYVHNDPNLDQIPEEPFAAFADSAGQFAMITHLTTGAVTLIDSPRGGPAEIADVLTGFFNPDPNTGLIGSTGIAGRTPSATGDIIYVGSSSEDRVQTFTVGRPLDDAPPYLLPSNWFFLDAVGAAAGGSTDTRGLAFSRDGNLLYLLNRNPASLQLIDTSPDATGFPNNRGISATSVCREASTLTVLDPGDGAERAYITCFQDGQIWVVDSRGLATVEDVLTVGRGPFAIVSAPTRHEIYVTNFLEDTIAVIDVAPNSPTRNRVVLRIGQPLDPNAVQ